jgi:hypothetical protein
MHVIAMRCSKRRGQIDALFDHLVRPAEQRQQHGEAERLGSVASEKLDSRVSMV